jgi:hypothetical protein
VVLSHEALLHHDDEALYFEVGDMDDCVSALLIELLV